MNDRGANPLRLGLVGWPVHRSPSPGIHESWCRTYGVRATYDLYPVRTTPDARRLLARMATEGFVGVNVTCPHKELAFAMTADRQIPTASVPGTVNTILFSGGRMTGANTDRDGFLHNLTDAAGTGWTRGPAAVFGAGGAARAVVAALGRAGVPEVRICNRTRARAERLAADMRPLAPASVLVVRDWRARAEMSDGCGLVVNATSLGAPGRPVFDVSPCSARPDATVADVVCPPSETALLRAARRAGMTVASGRGMLVRQAALSFAMWFGSMPDVTSCGSSGVPPLPAGRA